MQAVCAECVSRGGWGGLHGPAVIGMDKPCVKEFKGDEIYGNIRKGEGEWERGGKGGNQHGECGERNSV